MSTHECRVKECQTDHQVYIENGVGWNFLAFWKLLILLVYTTEILPPPHHPIQPLDYFGTMFRDSAESLALRLREGTGGSMGDLV